MENVSETVNKAFDILELFLQREGELSLAELAEKSGFNKATAYRLVSTLVHRGFVKQKERNGKYSLGLKSLDFTFAVRKNIQFIDTAYLYLSRLSKANNISAYISILDADSSLVVEEVALVDMMRINSPIGKRLPLHATASGRVLLASLSKEERAAFYARNTLRSYTSKTVTDIAQLETEIENIRVEGLACGEEDYKNGLFAIAAPLFNGNMNIIAAAGVVAPYSQFDLTSRAKLAVSFKGCCAEISQVIGRTN